MRLIGNHIVKHSLIFLAYIIGCTNLFAQTTNLYVSESGNDSNSGQSISDSDALKTIQGAYSKIITNSSNEVEQTYNIFLKGNIKPGNDAHDLSFEWTKSGTAQYNINLISYDTTSKARITRNNEYSRKNNFIFRFKHCKYINISYLIFEDAAAAIYLIASDDCRISKCDFFIDDFVIDGGRGVIDLSDEDTNMAPTVTKSKRNVISNNYIEFSEESIFDVHWGFSGDYHKHDLYHGIYIAHADKNTISNNTIINPPGSGIHIWGNHTTNNFISGNKIEMCYTHPYKNRCIDDPNKTFADIYERTIDGLRQGIIVAHAGLPLTVYNNKIENNIIIANRNLKIERSEFVSPHGIPTNQDDNTILVHNSLLDSNTFLDNTIPPISGSNQCETIQCKDNGSAQYESRFANRYHVDDIKLIRPEDKNEILVAIKRLGIILKIDGSGGIERNMFALEKKLDKFYNLPGYNYLLGTQYFTSPITDMQYINDGGLYYTLICFDDGRILRIKGTGGINNNIFAVVDDPYSGFRTISSDSVYYQGSYWFQNTIIGITPINGKTFISFKGGKILKVNGTGHLSNNMFEITEDGNGFSSINGYNYYAGHAKFEGDVVQIKNINSTYTFFCFDNGKILKITGNNGTGGTNRNMFAVNESESGFTGISGFSYFSGSAKFEGAISHIVCIDNNHSLLCFNNGKLLKIKGNAGTGGFGNNMFAVSETENGFSGLSGFDYFCGSIKFDEFVKTSVFNQDSYYIGFNMGTVKRVKDLANENITSVWSETVPSTGNAFFLSSVSDIKIIDNYLFIALMDGKILKLETNSYGNNMFNLAGVSLNSIIRFPETQFPKRLFGYQNLDLASQNNSLKATSNGKDDIKDFNNLNIALITEPNIIIYPNPIKSYFNIDFNIENDDYLTIDILNSNGELVAKLTENKFFIKGQYSEKYNIDNQNLSNGLYFCRIKTNSKVFTRKMLLVK